MRADPIYTAFHEWLEVIQYFFVIDLIDTYGYSWDVGELHQMWRAMYRASTLHAREFQRYSAMEKHTTIQEAIHQFRTILNTVESYNIPLYNPQSIIFIRKSTNEFEESMYCDISG
jgi:hypothetical protein